MKEEVREKLLSIYNSITENTKAVEQVFIDQFGEEYVDSSIPTFDSFVDSLDIETLGSLGIVAWKGANEDGQYSIDKEDYERNGRGKKLLDYIPDLGILDYLKTPLRSKISFLSCTDPIAETANILIRFPQVKVTNEYDKSIDISELYVKVRINFKGNLLCKFGMTRAEYTIAQWTSDYAHSHLSGINKSNPEKFKTPCTGQGPINRTISTLMREYNLDIWGLFAFELSKFVAVESISGIPYRRLENVGTNDTREVTPLLPYQDSIPYFSSYSRKDLKDFVRHFLLSETLKVSFIDGNYTLGESFNDFWIKVSNSFIRWHNNNVRENKARFTLNILLESTLLGKYLVAGSTIYNAHYSRDFNETELYEGRELFKFKGQTVRLHFTDRALNSDNITYLVAKELCFYILTKAIEIISCSYGREYAEEAAPHTRCFYA